jgi:hypothetical protein
MGGIKIKIQKNIMFSDVFMKKLKKLRKFRNISEEKRFWKARDSSEYIDWSKAKKATFPQLKPSTKTISLRSS